MTQDLDEYNKYNDSSINYAILVLKNNSIFWVNNKFLEFYETNLENTIGYRPDKFQPSAIRKLQQDYYISRFDNPKKHLNYTSFGLTLSGSIFPIEISVIKVDNVNLTTIVEIRKKPSDAKLNTKDTKKITELKSDINIDEFILHKLNNTILPSKLILDFLEQNKNEDPRDHLDKISQSIDQTIEILKQFKDASNLTKFTRQAYTVSFLIEYLLSRYGDYIEIPDEEILNKVIVTDLEKFNKLIDRLRIALKKLFKTEDEQNIHVIIENLDYDINANYLIDEVLYLNAELLVFSIYYNGDPIDDEVFTENYLFSNEVSIDSFLLVDLVKKLKGILDLAPAHKNKVKNKIIVAFQLSS